MQMFGLITKIENVTEDNPSHDSRHSRLLVVTGRSTGGEFAFEITPEALLELQKKGEEHLHPR